MFVVAGFAIWITPPYIHISFELLLRAGLPPISTVGEPGIQGAVVTGIQGMGVRTPIAAAVAAATAGFAGFLHIPNGMMFVIGMLSMIVATGVEDVTRLTGSTFSTDGVMPKEQLSVAPPHTQKAIYPLSLFYIYPRPDTVSPSAAGACGVFPIRGPGVLPGPTFSPYSAGLVLFCALDEPVPAVGPAPEELPFAPGA